MDEFEKLLEAERVSVERFVRFRMSSKADIRNPLSLPAHERSRIPLTHRLVLYTLEAGDCLFCVQNDVKIVIFGKADMPGM